MNNKIYIFLCLFLGCTVQLFGDEEHFNFTATGSWLNNNCKSFGVAACFNPNDWHGLGSWYYKEDSFHGDIVGNYYYDFMKLSFYNMRINTIDYFKLRFCLINTYFRKDWSPYLPDEDTNVFIHINNHHNVIEFTIFDYDQTRMLDLNAKWLELRWRTTTLLDEESLPIDIVLLPSAAFKAGLTSISAGSDKCPLFGKGAEKTLFGLETGVILNFDIYFSYYLKWRSNLDIRLLFSSMNFNFINLKSDFILNPKNLFSGDASYRGDYIEIGLGYEFLGGIYKDEVHSNFGINLSCSYWLEN